jgi:hypothetical protein
LLQLLQHSDEVSCQQQSARSCAMTLYIVLLLDRGANLSVMRDAHNYVNRQKEKEQQERRCLLQRWVLQGMPRLIPDLGVSEDRRGEEGDNGDDR